MIARLTVVDGALTEYPLAEKVKGGWQNGVTFYPDEKVTAIAGTYAHVGGLVEYLDALPTHITSVPVSHIRNVLAGRRHWQSGDSRCLCTPAIAGISDGPNVDCHVHGERES